MKLFVPLHTWKYRLRERYFKLLHTAPRQVPLSWQLDQSELDNVVVRWPTRYQWVGAQQWGSHLVRGLRSLVRVERVPLEQPYPGMMLAEVVRSGQSHLIAIDYCDDHERLQHGCLNDVALYFKLQYRQGGYGNERIVPGGYVNPTEDYYSYLSWLRATRDEQEPHFNVYGRFGLEWGRSVRERAVQMLHGQNRFRYEGSMGTVRYGRSLEEAALSQVCVDLPGNGDFCFRLIDYLGIGSCVVAAPHRTTLHVPLEDRRHLVYTKPDLSDLVDLCQHYLEYEDERAELVQNSRDFFDRYLHREQLAAYYLSTALTRIQQS